MTTDEFDEGLDPDETPSGFESLPPQTQAEIKKLRQENKSVRTRLSERENELLTAKYVAEDVELAQEFPSFEKKVEFLEKLKARTASAGSPSATPEQTEPQAPEPPSEERRAAEAVIAAQVRTPSSGGTPPAVLSAHEIRELMISDPAAGREAAQAKYGQGA